MKYTALLSLAAATLLFTACGEDTQKEVAEATAKTTEAVKGTASDIKNAASELADKTAQKSKELAEAAEVKMAEAQKVLKEKAAETTEAVKKTIASGAEDDKKGQALYAKCAGCHGKDGKTKALGKSELIAGQSKDVLEKKIHEYKAGTRNVVGMGTLMKGQVASMSDEDIEEVSEYISEIH